MQATGPFAVQYTRCRYLIRCLRPLDPASLLWRGQPAIR
jgi:hypothetical protein